MLHIRNSANSQINPPIRVSPEDLSYLLMPKSLDSKLLGVKEVDPSWAWWMEEARILKMHHLRLFLLHLLWSKCRGFIYVCSSDISCFIVSMVSVCVYWQKTLLSQALSTHSHPQAKSHQCHWFPLRNWLAAMCVPSLFSALLDGFLFQVDHFWEVPLCVT